MKILSLTAIVAVAVCFSLPAPAWSGLVARWIFDGETPAGGTVQNSANPGFGDGTLVGNAYTSGGVLHLDGAGDYITIADDPIFTTFESGNKVTIAAWIKSDTLAGRQTIFTSGSTGPADATGAFGLELGVGSGGSNRAVVITPGVWNAETANNALVAGQWTHVAYSKDATTQNIYVNGVEQALSPDDPRTFLNNAVAKMIGVRRPTNTGDKQFFAGQMREVAIYDEALLPDQFMPETRWRRYGETVLADDPTIYWRLDDVIRSTGATALNSATTGSGLGATGNGLYHSGGGSNPGVKNVSDTMFNVSGIDFDTAAHFGDSAASGNSGDAVILNPLPAGAFPSNAISVEMWVRADLPAATNQALLSYNTVSDPTKNELLLFKAGNDFVVYLDSVSKATALDARDLFDGNWNHLVVTWQSSDGALRTYLNGLPVGLDTLGKDVLLEQGGSLLLAQEQDGVATGFDNTQKLVGDLDEVAIYGFVLTPEQVWAHYTAAVPEPASAVLLAIGIVGVFGCRPPRRRLRGKLMHGTRSMSRSMPRFHVSVKCKV